MKILQVVTYISSDGAFGGPVRVALEQSAELARRGHDVTIYAAAPIAECEDRIQDGVGLRLFPARRLTGKLGFADMYARGMRAALASQLREADVLHIHLARDLVTLPAARISRRAEVPFVVQPHGMIRLTGNPLAAPIDRWETRRALSAAGSVLTLTADEERDIGIIAPGAPVSRIINGVAPSAPAPYEDRENLVLYLARLHPRKRPQVFVEAASILNGRGVEACYRLVGPDEGEGALVESAIAEIGARNIAWTGPVSPAHTDALMRAAKVYVLPSVGEVFPMSVLEAFRAGTPVVTTDSLGIADDCNRFGAALVTDGTGSSIAAAIEKVLTDAAVAERLREGASRMLSTLGIDVVADRLLVHYQRAISKQEVR